LEEFGTVPGDADLDKSVEIGDFLILSSSFGRAGFWSDGKFDDDGVVGFSDFLLLSENFGNASATVVPEPATHSISMAALTLMLFRRRNVPNATKAVTL